jgi:hypothetical protein
MFGNIKKQLIKQKIQETMNEIITGAKSNLTPEMIESNTRMGNTVLDILNEAVRKNSDAIADLVIAFEPAIKKITKVYEEHINNMVNKL